MREPGGPKHQNHATRTGARPKERERNRQTKAGKKKGPAATPPAPKGKPKPQTLTGPSGRELTWRTP